MVDPVVAASGPVTARRPPSFLIAAAVLPSLFLVMVDNTAINLALPRIQHDLGASLSQLEWAVNAYILTFASLILCAAGLMARHSVRRVFISGLALFGLGSVGCGLATGPYALIAAGALQGAGAAALVPSGLALIDRERTAPRGIDPVALWSVAVAAGVAAGPVVGGVLTSFVGWRAIFLVNAPIILVCLLIARSHSSPIAPSPAKPGDPLSVGLSALALFALTFAVIDSASASSSLRVVGAVVVSAAAGSCFVARQRRRPSVVDLSLFREPKLVAAAVGALVVGFALFGTILFVSILEQSLGRSPAVAGLMFAPLTAAMVLAAPGVGHLRRYRAVTAPRMAVAGLIVFTFGLAVLSRTCDGIETTLMAVSFAVAGIGIALTSNSLTSFVTDAVSGDASDAAAAVVATARQVGGALGIGVMGLIVQTAAAPSLPSGTTASGAYVAAVSIALVVASGVVLAGAVVVGLLAHVAYERQTSAMPLGSLEHRWTEQ